MAVIPTSVSPSTSGFVSGNVTSTPTYYEISDDDDLVPLSPVHKSVLHDMFPTLDSGQEALLLELYGDDVHKVIEALLKGITSSSLL